MKAGIVIPPSPNWYSTNTVDCHRPTGLIAYASSRSLVFVWPTKKRNDGFPRTAVLTNAHFQRITGVSWCQSNKSPLLLSTCSEDGFVCFWNAENKSLVLEYNFSQKLHFITWSPADPSNVVTLCEDGTASRIVLTSEHKICSIKKLKFWKKIPLLAYFNPFASWMLAVGCKGGMLYLIDTRGIQKVIHKIRAHEEDILSLVWCPISKPKNEGTIASSSRDTLIKIWDAKSGNCLAQGKIPSIKKESIFINHLKSSINHLSSNTSHQSDQSHIWIALDWTNGDRILSSGPGGELLLWDVELKNWNVVNKRRNQGLFTIASYEIEGKQMIWTSAQDRILFLWQLECDGPSPKKFQGIPEMEDPWLCVPTLGGFVYCISHNPSDVSQVALGLGDGTVRLWNITAREPDMTTIWKLIKGRVTSLSWHPVIEGSLAFGTDEGMVGLLEIVSHYPLSWKHRFHQTCHTRAVYTLSWAPLPSREGQMDLRSNFVLYSCDGHNIFIDDPSTPEALAVNFNLLVEGGSSKFPSRTEFQWKADFSMLAVGNKDGSVDVYKLTRGKFICIGVIVVHKKLIQSIRWHPQFTFQNKEQSKYQTWLAVASDKYIKVFDISCNPEGKMSSSLVATFSGHKGRVVKIAWNARQDGLLLSASYDGTSQAWNVIEQKRLASFGEHCGHVLACDWNVLETDTAITGGSDYTVRVWNVKDQVHKMPTEAIAARPVNKERKNAEFQTSASRSVNYGTGISAPKKTTTLESLFPVSANLEARGHLQGLNDCKVLATLAGVQIKHFETQDDRQVTPEEIGSGQYSNLGIFGDKDSVDRMLQVEFDHHMAGTNFDLAAQLQLWRGSMENVLKEAARKKRLTDWLVSLAPQVSPEFWKEMCQDYAKQLATDGDVRKAVSYFVAAGFHNEAFKTLDNHQMYREAAAFSRSIYPANDERIVQSLSQWAVKAAGDRSFELAAKCYLAIGQVAEATRTLPRRGQRDSLRLAADLATHCHDDQLAAAYFIKASEKTAAAVVVPNGAVGQIKNDSK